ncbi:MAG: DNA polymerase III subunit alpha, partial [Chloroflexi bacterium]|nr:DNA polymerase III subunit alpha [Chloroflexota bacterium]
EMPDIDMDFQDDRRDEVIQYVVQKYGQERVAQIITFGTLGPKAAIRDVGRALGMTYADVDRVARLVPFRAKTLDEAAEMAPELKELWTADQQLQRLLDTAKKLEGVVRHASTHAAGVVISGEPLTEYAPLQQPVRGEGAGISMTQFSMDPIAKLGLLKMDFLGLTNLTILDRAIAIIGRERGVTLDLARVPLDDPPTFRLLSSGETTDLFQLEGAGMRRYIKELKPTSLRDIAAMIALYRPGPMEHIETYIRAKHGLERVRYPHPVLKDVLEETYGVIVYQDQVLFIVRAFAGYSLGEADVIRKAMGKKIPEIMQREKEQFLARAVSKGYSHQDAEAVFSLIEPFAGYAFNKAHSVSYALIAYWTAYLKANYPVEYMCAVLDTRLGNLEKVPTTVAECQRLGVPVLPPDVDHSEVRFTIEAMPQDKRGIRFGLEAIKNVGAAAVAPIVEARRKGGPFRSISDFCGRVDLRGVNRRTLESLIKVGALDSLGDRGALLASVERILSLAQRQAAQREAGQISMFDLFGQAAEAPLPTLELPTSKTSGREKLEWERELLGVPLSENPFSALVAALAGSEAVLSRHQIEPEMAGQKLVLVGQVASVRQGLTREQKPFISASVALMDGAVDVVAWPPVSEETQELWADGSLLWIVGKVRVRDDRLSLVCEEARPYVLPAAPEEVSTPVVTPEGMAKEVPLGQRGAPPVVPAAGRPRSGNGTNGQSEHGSAGTLYLTFQESDDPGADEARLREALKLLLEFPGRDKLYLQVQTTGGQVTLEMPSITVSWSPALQRAVAEQLGGWASLRGGSEERL